MPHRPQTALIRLLQGIAQSREIAPGDRVAVAPHFVLLTARDAAALDVLASRGGKVAAPARVVLAGGDEALIARARAAGITRFLAAGCELTAMLEQALVVSGECAASSLPEIHALGGIGALGLRLPAADLGVLLATTTIEITVPQVIRVDLAGTRQPQIGGRDVFWNLRRELGLASLVGRALEITGLGLATLKLHERQAMCSMAAHAGLFAAFCLADRAGVAELNATIQRPYTALEPEKGANWAQVATCDLGHAQTCVLAPGSSQARPVAEFHGQRIDQVLIGGEGSGSLEAMRLLAETIKLRRLAPYVVCAAIPNSERVRSQAQEEDLLNTLEEAGVALHPPGTVPARVMLPDRNTLLTTVTAPPGCWRSGPIAAAAAASAGVLTHPERLDDPNQRDSKHSARAPRANG